LVDSHFKALVHLLPGPNIIKFTFIPPDHITSTRFSTKLTLHYLPLLQDPPVHLAIVLARDSSGVFTTEGTGEQSPLAESIKRLRMAAYLFQAYTAEHMCRNFPGAAERGGSARRSFRVEEDWIEDTLTLQETGVWRTSAKVHVVLSTLSEKGVYAGER
jgi:Putative peptidase family